MSQAALMVRQLKKVLKGCLNQSASSLAQL
jgi:hypothetical protein